MDFHKYVNHHVRLVFCVIIGATGVEFIIKGASMYRKWRIWNKILHLNTSSIPSLKTLAGNQGPVYCAIEGKVFAPAPIDIPVHHILYMN